MGKFVIDVVLILVVLKSVNDVMLFIKYRLIFKYFMIWEQLENFKFGWLEVCENQDFTIFRLSPGQALRNTSDLFEKF
jgi:hypothetical protein